MICQLCNNTGVIETGNNDLPCTCEAGDKALFNDANCGTITGAQLKRHYKLHENKYCGYCGHELKHYWTGYYNVYDGSKSQKLGCVNPSCKEGCRNTNGHKRKFLTSFCIKCGEYMSGSK